MAAQLIDGKALSDELRGRLRAEAAELAKRGILPGLAVVMVGEDPASRVYVGNKRRACASLGLHSEEYILPERTTQAELISLLEKLNQKKNIHGILVQLPLPAHLEERAVMEAISPHKDVDALGVDNAGRLMLENYRLLPCTPAGVMELLEWAGIPIEGRECVVVGTSNIVGKPLGLLLLHRGGTVTFCHKLTQNLAQATRRADILVAAAGAPGLITADMVKPGAAVVDVGINPAPGGGICGDVAFEEVRRVAGHITPVPGGVGPMTITMLLKNTILAAKALECMGQRGPGAINSHDKAVFC